MRTAPQAGVRTGPPGTGAPPRRRRTAALGVVASVAAATAVAALLDPHVSLTVLAMVYLVAVVGVSYRSSRVPSAATAVLAVGALNFFFVPPRGTFSVESPEHLLTLAALLGVALLVSSLSARLRSTAQQARQREQRAHDLQRLAGALAAQNDAAGIAQAGLDTLQAAGIDTLAIALRADDGRLALTVPDGRELPAGAPHRDALAHCGRECRELGAGTARWNGLEAWYLPLCAGGRRFGALAVRPAGRVEGAREHVRIVADLLAGALLRARHVREAAAADAEAQAQKLRNALLAAVSHDFRTPLASIIGAVSSLREQDDRLDAADRLRLLALIEDEARHLSAMTDNTLQWVRLSAPLPALRLDWESVEEIVGTVLARVRRRDPARRIRAQVQGGLPLVRADAVLLGQLLDNLLDNALKFSAGPVRLRAAAVDRTVQLEVLDRGPGIGEAELPHVFDTFFRGVHARGVRGSGLGLAVCRAIAAAHGATLSAGPRPGGGSRFVVCLPVEAASAALAGTEAPAWP